MGSLDGRRHEDVYVDRPDDRRAQARGQAALRYFSGASPDGSQILYYVDGDYHVYSLADRAGAQHHPGAAGLVRRHRRRSQQRQAAGQRDRLGERQQDGPADRRLGHLAGAGRRRRRRQPDASTGKKDAIRYQRRFALEPPEERGQGIDLSKPQYFPPTASGPRRPASRASSRASPASKMLTWGDATYPAADEGRKDADTYLLHDGTALEPGGLLRRRRQSLAKPACA